MKVLDKTYNTLFSDTNISNIESANFVLSNKFGKIFKFNNMRTLRISKREAKKQISTALVVGYEF